MVECETPNRPYMLGHNIKTGEAILYRPDCGLWDCPHCGVVNAKRWAARIRKAVAETADGLHSKCVWVFVTITLKTRSKDLDYQIEIFRHAWDVFSKRMRRRAVRKVTYVLIPELSPKKRRLHAHILMDWDCECKRNEQVWINKKGEKIRQFRSPFLHDNLYGSGLGYEYDIQPIDQPDLVSYYITKYVSKNLGTKFPKGFRRVRTSHEFPKDVEMEKTGAWTWEAIQCNADGRKKLLAAVLGGEIIIESETKRAVRLSHDFLAR